MSHSYFTRNLLKINDKNINFQEDYIEEVKHNGVTSFVFKGTLSYQPTHCEHCGTLLIQSLKSVNSKLLEL